MSESIVNKVTDSGLLSIDLEKYYPRDEIIVFDLKRYLFMELILKEKDFREALKNIDWGIYAGRYVCVTCTADAIIPMWAYMLVTSNLQPVVREVFTGDEKEFHKQLFLRNIQAVDIKEFEGKRVIIKGCGDLPVGEFAFAEITKLLRPVARSIMYGEPCSTVPVFKKSAVKE